MSPTHEKIDDFPFVFLGIAEHVRVDEKAPFPFGPVDIFRLSKHKIHFFFPVSLNYYTWVFLINARTSLLMATEKPRIEFSSENGERLFHVDILGEGPFDNKRHPEATFSTQPVIQDIGKVTWVPFPKETKWHLFCFKVDRAIIEPGTYNIRACLGNKETLLDEVLFNYRKAEPFKPEQIKAIQASAYSRKSVIVEIGCKHCPSKMSAYSALERNAQLESEGKIWQYDLGESFECECGETSVPLKYMKESLHALLGGDVEEKSSNLSFERRYIHAEIVKIIREFQQLLQQHEDEKPFQQFIEDNPVILARFNAKKLFFKTSILGKFKTDFAIVDTRNQLLMIELERPSLKLFKRNGHPTADLNHAYEQVCDWMGEYRTHPYAVLDLLNLKTDEVSVVRGVVIAGRSEGTSPEHIKRHRSKNSYPDVEFLTLDDLAESLMQISRDLVSA